MHSDIASVVGLLAFVSVVTAAACSGEVVANDEGTTRSSAGGGSAAADVASAAFGSVGPAANTSAANAMAALE